MDIRLIDASFATVEEHLALDEALLLGAEADENEECMRFWEWPTPTVVLGAGGSIALDVNEVACRNDAVALHRRSSGGGTVVLGDGCLLFSLVLAYERAAELRDVNASYRWILNRIASALRSIANVTLAGISDLAIDGRKISGNAQQRKSRFLLHHGTLLYNFDLPLIGRYLKRPEREPTYREGREHLEFTANIPTTASTLRKLIATAFATRPGETGAAAFGRVDALIAEKYGRDDWVRRR